MQHSVVGGFIFSRATLVQHSALGNAFLMPPKGAVQHRAPSVFLFSRAC
jgi:hypothetical protein